MSLWTKVVMILNVWKEGDLKYIKKLESPKPDGRQNKQHYYK